MNTNTINFSQLFLRLAFAVTLLSAVADRLGIWGPPGAPNVAWGDWEHFLAYSNKLNFYVSPQVGNILAILATALEVIFAVMFLIGYKIKLASWGTCLLMVIFALSMTVAMGVKPPLSYSVWTSAGAAALLGSINKYKWSIDNLK
ncbi:MauE/DoxX family redox-associated membrane protein [Chitinophaga sp. CF418]|uniref:MauE/DoxX family redox-associated membrane protein n=1 Tax=Chitinophaga sp. CF418 TaxID=1855287 RepID=UPI0009182658|nr:MauE/DoxX family redox-associated membrane protein [Chitinophaga sp. CF418]SHN10898.1 DoxX protein [Chitinophaga sp. CF418]